MMISGPIHLISSDFKQFFSQPQTGQSAHAGITDFMPVETALQSSCSKNNNRSLFLNIISKNNNRSLFLNIISCRAVASQLWLGEWIRNLSCPLQRLTWWGMCTGLSPLQLSIIEQVRTLTSSRYTSAQSLQRSNVRLLPGVNQL